MHALLICTTADMNFFGTNIFSEISMIDAVLISLLIKTLFSYMALSLSVENHLR